MHRLDQARHGDGERIAAGQADDGQPGGPGDGHDPDSHHGGQGRRGRHRGVPRREAFFAFLRPSQRDVSDDARRATPIHHRLRGLRQDPGCGPARGNRQREAGPTASEGEGGGRGHGSERAVLHRDPDRPVDISGELVGLTEHTYLRLCDRSASEHRGAQQRADAEGEACNVSSRAGHPHAALTGTPQGWSALYEGAIPIDLTPSDHQPEPQTWALAI